MALPSGFAAPRNCLFLITRHALARHIHHAQMILGLGIALLRGFTGPLGRFVVIFRRSTPNGIHYSKNILRLSIALLSGWDEIAQGFLISAGKVSNFAFSWQVGPYGRNPKPCHE